MNENFYLTAAISKGQMSNLLEKHNRPALLRYVGMYAAFLTMNVVVVYTWGKPVYIFIPAQLVYAVLCCSVFASLHETGHGTAFASNTLNKTAAFLSGFGHVYPPSLFRALHFTHHRFTHIPGKDPEISLGNRPAPPILQSMPLYLSFLTGLPLLLYKIVMLVSGALGMPESIRQTLFPFIAPNKRKAIFVESVLFLILYGLLIGYGFWRSDLRLLGILTGQIIGHCLLSFYLSMEHNGLPHEGNILEKTRSINTNALVKWIMWNMPYHAEHHAYPAVPFYALPQLHEYLANEMPHQQETHFSFHAKAVGGLLGSRK